MALGWWGGGETEDGRVVAVWEYDDREAYERVQAAVFADPATRCAQELRRGLPALFSEKDEVFMRSAPSVEASAKSVWRESSEVRASETSRRRS